MKKYIFSMITGFALLIQSQPLFSQAPDSINYQAVARDLSGNPLISTPVGLQFEVIIGSLPGSVVYTETHATNTNQFGSFSVAIGGGTPTSGTFAGISWSSGLYHLRVTVNGDIMPETKLLSVPFALHANTAASGPAGANGHANLADSVSVLAGANCANGGYLIHMGADDNDDGTLQPLERDINYYICNGLDGADNNSDTSATNELQTLSISNDTIFLTNGSFVPLPSVSTDADWTVNGINMYTDASVTGNVGIGNNTPSHKLTVNSSDSIIASFRSDNPNFGAITVTSSVPTAPVGIILLSGPDTAIFGIDPNDKILVMNNSIAGGHIALNADSSVVSYAEVIGNIANSKILNQADTIFSVPNTGNNLINVNRGSFYTDSLHVLGNNAFNLGYALINDGLGQAQWEHPDSLGISSSNLWQQSGSDIFFNTGKVGIGNGTPQNALDVHTPTLNTFSRFTNATSGNVANDGVFLGISSGNAFFNNAENGHMLFYTNNNEKMRIDSLGNVGVGTQSPSTKLHVSGGAIGQPIALFEKGGLFNAAININHTGSNGSRINFQNGGVITSSISSSTTNVLHLNSQIVEVGISPQAAKFNVVSSSSTPANPTVQLHETSNGFSSIKYTNAVGAGKYWITEAGINASDAVSAYSIGYNDGVSTTKLPFLVYGSGKVGVNSLNAPVGIFHVMDNNGSYSMFEGMNQAGEIKVARSNQPSFARQQVLNGETIGNVTFPGAIGTTFGNGPQITALATENFTGTNNGSELTFKTIANGATTHQDALRLLNDGTIEVPINLRVLQGAGNANDVLTSDILGNATWQAPTAVSVSPWTKTGSSIHQTVLTENIGIGTATPIAVTQLHIAHDGQAIVGIQASGTVQDEGANISLLRTQGNLLAPGQVQTGDRLGKVEFLGYDDVSNFSEGASIRGVAEQAFTSTNHGARLEFHTSQNTGGSSEVMRLTEGGNVGIGTTTPNLLGSFKATTISASTIYSGVKPVGLELQGSQNSANSQVGKLSYLQGNGIELSRIETRTGGGNAFHGQLAFYTQDGASLNEVMRINEGGNVGIGTSAPGDKLHVENGSLLVNNGHIRSGGVAFPTITNGGISGNDIAGKIDLTINGSSAIITFAITYTNPPAVIITPANAQSATSDYFVFNVTTTGFEILAPTGGGSGEFYYQVIEY